HRDIKPSNIIITPSGRAKLVDLGLARKESTESTPDLTMAGTTLGTFDYISPEQAKDPRNVDVRSDIYSLGCTLYHMLTGEPPYPEGTVLKKLLDHQSGEPPDPSKKNRRVSDDLSLVCRKMMASDQKRRYQTPDQLIHDLMMIAGSLGLRGVSPEGLIWLKSQHSMSDFWRQNVGVIAMAALLIVIVVGVERFPNLVNDRSQAAPLNQTGTNLPVTHNNAAAIGADTKSTGKKELDPPEDDANSGTSTPAENSSQAISVPERHGTFASGRGSALPLMPLFPGWPHDLFDDSQDPLISPLVIRPDSSSLTSVDKSKTDEGTSGRELASNSGRTGNSGAATEPRDSSTTNDKSTATAEESSGVFVLAADGSPAKRFPTLEAACAAVADGSVIELRYNSRRVEKPLRLSKKNVTIRAARGFHPIVEFALDSVATDAHLRLIGVSSGPVQINNVAFEISIPSFFAVDRISLFSVDRAEQLRLQGVAITLNNPGQRPTALFDLSSEPGQMLADMKMNMNGMARDPLEIELTECFVRGHGDLFHVRNTKPGRLSLRDTAIAIDGSLLRVEGHSDKPAEQTRLELRLEHVTGVVGQNLVRLDSGDLPRELPPVKVDARNNILSLTGNGSLVAMNGNTSDADFRNKLFVWSGERNFYDRCPTFWTFVSGEPFDFDDWKAKWGSNGDVGASNEKLSWLADRADMATVSLEALTLDRKGTTPKLTKYGTKPEILAMGFEPGGTKLAVYFTAGKAEGRPIQQAR
ncbi:MAG: serine/threonine protein kinase, partial [Planctomycetaceae bacterium]|nr:serine/threonine protein kinase [Planctomycetaceae bacterium]